MTLMNATQLAEAQRVAAVEVERSRQAAFEQMTAQAAKPRGNRRKLRELAVRCWELDITEPEILSVSGLSVNELRVAVRREVESDYQYEQDLSASLHGA